MSKYQVVWRNHLVDKDDPAFESCHGIFSSERECMDSIREWWDLNDFKPYYTRSWKNKRNETVIDYGCHHYFYYIVELKEGEVDED